MKENTTNKSSEISTWLLVAIVVIGIGYWAAQVKINPQPTPDDATPNVETSNTDTAQPTPATKLSTTASSDTAFAFKQKCASYRTAIGSKMGTKNIGGITMSHTLDEIFYSPVRNSCLYSQITKSGVYPNMSAFYTIYDYLQDTQIYWNTWSPPEVLNENGELVRPYPTEPNPSYYQFVAEKNRLKGN